MQFPYNKKEDMHKRYRFRIYPNKRQQKMFAKIFGVCRFAYNYALNLKISDYEKQKKIKDDNPDYKIKTISSFDISKLITEMKHTPEYEWINEIPAACIGHPLRNLDAAYRNFFRNIKKGEKPGFPKFKNKNDGVQSFSFHQGYKVNFDEGWMTVPKCEKVKTVFHRRFTGDYKTSTIIKEPSGKYFVSIVVDEGLGKNGITNPGDFVGVDHGVNKTLTLSDGTRVMANLDFAKQERKQKRLQRSLDKKKRGSMNYKKMKIKVARQYDKIKNKRTWEIQNAVNELMLHLESNQYGGIVIRKYDVLSMVAKKEPVKNDKGGYEKNGREVQKRITKKIMNSSLGYIRNYMKYKLESKGYQVVEVDVDERTTSKCNRCKEEKNININLKSRKMSCKNCNYKEDIDYNAAKNIIDNYRQMIGRKEVI